jgi:hypothetical protein
MLDLIPIPQWDHYANADTWGFSDGFKDLPIPDDVSKWMEAIDYAADKQVLLWSKPASWDQSHVARRVASVHTMSKRRNLYVRSRRHRQDGRIYFRIVEDPADLWT